MCRSQHVRFPRHRLLRARTRRPMPIVTAVVAVANKRSRRRRHRHRHRHHTHVARRRSAATRAATHAIYGRYFIAYIAYIDARARTSHRDVQHAKASLNLGTQSPRRRKTVRTVSVHATTRRRETGLRTSSNITYHCSYYILKRRDAEVSARRVMTCACIAKCNVRCERPRRATRCDAMRSCDTSNDAKRIALRGRIQDMTRA
jgi:hypothetical protein